MTANSVRLQRLTPQPNAINSALYAAADSECSRRLLEVVGRSGIIRRLARVAVSAGRADASLAIGLCLVWIGSAAVGNLCRGCATVRASPAAPRFLLAYLCGVLWYMGNCYWVRDIMMQYGDMPPLAPTLLLVGYSLVLGLYFGLFGLAVALVQKATGSTRLALAAAPVLLGRAGTGRRAHHLRALGPARLLAGG